MCSCNSLASCNYTVLLLTTLLLLCIRHLLVTHRSCSVIGCGRLGVLITKWKVLCTLCSLPFAAQLRCYRRIQVLDSGLCTAISSFSVAIHCAALSIAVSASDSGHCFLLSLLRSSCIMQYSFLWSSSFCSSFKFPSWHQSSWWDLPAFRQKHKKTERQRVQGESKRGEPLDDWVLDVVQLMFQTFPNGFCTETKHLFNRKRRISS